MPIRESQKALYPPNWKEISLRIRFDRAKSRCECRGECGDHWHPYRYLEVDGRCGALNGQPIQKIDADGIPYKSGKSVVLTVAHLNHDPRDVRDENLRALCQRCHLARDRHNHSCTRAETRDANRGQADMFGYDEARRQGGRPRSPVPR